MRPVQTTISFGPKRPALGETSANASKKPKLTKSASAPAIPTAASTSATPAPKPESQTLTQLRAVTRETAKTSVERLVAGYTDRSGSGYPAATTNSMGCQLCQKVPNRAQNGYIQIVPISDATRAGTKNGIQKEAMQPQNGHRLVVLAYKTDEEIERMLNGEHCSHLCHIPICLNPEHLTVEPKEKNEGRKDCAGRVAIRAVIDATVYMFMPEKVCVCEPRCILRVEDRVGTLSD